MRGDGSRGSPSAPTLFDSADNLEGLKSWIHCRMPSPWRGFTCANKGEITARFFFFFFNEIFNSGRVLNPAFPVKQQNAVSASKWLARRKTISLMWFCYVQRVGKTPVTLISENDVKKNKKKQRKLHAAPQLSQEKQRRPVIEITAACFAEKLASRLIFSLPPFFFSFAHESHGFGRFLIQAIWAAAKWNGIHPAFLMENPKSIDVSLWRWRRRGAPSCGWKACPNKPGQTVCFCCSAAVNLCIFFSFLSLSLPPSCSLKERGTRERQVRDDTGIISRYEDCVYASGPGG